jgi:hypothetical protein
MYLSTALALLGASFLGFVRFTILLTGHDLEIAIASKGNVASRVGMNRRFSRAHKHPVFALQVSRQPGAGHGRQAQGSISSSPIYIIANMVGHMWTVAMHGTVAIV